MTVRTRLISLLTQSFSTKRATSIIAHNANIYPHPNFTQTLDYEGEIGVIVGKARFPDIRV